jgi:hypothetical protein
MSNATNAPAGHTATFEKRYALKAAGPHTAKGLTLYEARKALLAAQAAGHLTDATHVRRGDRAVAFFCEWRHEVRAMFGAHPAERAVLADWA